MGGVIYPVAIKYDARFGDPFWDSGRYSMVQYLLMMMSSWAIVCDVWYLPPMHRRHAESAVDFANRVRERENPFMRTICMSVPQFTDY